MKSSRKKINKVKTEDVTKEEIETLKRYTFKSNIHLSTISFFHLETTQAHTNTQAIKTPLMQ